MVHITVSISTQTLLGLMEGPSLLSKHVRIGDHIVDAIILDAHPEVARWYGYEHPESMRGRYLSQLHERTCLERVRHYAVARQLGVSGVPDVYDMCILLPNGRRRWLRKLGVRQIREGSDTYWVSQSKPITAEQAQPMPDIALPISEAALEDLVGWGSVADAERLILETHISASEGQCQQDTLKRDTTLRGRNMQALLADLKGGLAAYDSFEIPLGDPLYRRWVHRCRRCGKAWVAETATPKKCNHCKSPYWSAVHQRRPGRSSRIGEAT
jgi:hypothetical protein